MELDRRDIETLAYFIWEKQGCPSDRAMEHWLEAEYLVYTHAFSNDRPLPEVITPSV
jgi:hypothetical protein